MVKPGDPVGFRGSSSREHRSAGRGAPVAAGGREFVRLLETWAAPPGALRTAEPETACEGWVGAGWERGGRKCVGRLGVGAASIFFWHLPPPTLRFPVGLRVGEEGTRGSIRGMMIGKQGGGS